MAYASRSKVERLLDELCTDLGFCLPAPGYEQLQKMLPMSIDAFTDAVFQAEGLEPRIKTELRRQARERIARRFLDKVTNDAT